jgi:hypothetical protein
MRPITDEDLTLLYYGEHEDPEIAATVAESELLSARYDALCAELRLADAYQPPLRGDDYGSKVWQRISPQLVDDRKPALRFRGWLASFVQPRFSLAGALSIALVTALAFMLGRNGGLETGNEPPAAAGTAPASMAEIDSSRLLSRSVASHLEQVNIVMTQFVNTSETNANEAGYVTDILVANRLYRQAAATQGDQQLAAFLADLEPLLIEMAYQAQSGSAVSRERMQQEIKDGLLFRVRLMNKQLSKPDISV